MNTATKKVLAAALAVAALSACAATGGPGSAYMPPPIPEGKGRLTIQAGGINQLNFYIMDQATGEEVYEDMPRMASWSPSAFDSGVEQNRLTVDLDPGTYTVVVNTDIEDDVVIDDVVVTMGQEVYATARVGRFQIHFQGGDNLGPQIPFLIWDYNMTTVLGRGMTSSQVRRFIVPEGRYKVRIENSAGGLDTMRPLEVDFGRITQLMITTETQQDDTQDDQSDTSP